MEKIHCPDCNGMGNYVIHAHADDGFIHDEEIIDCYTCKGTGIVYQYEL